MQAPKSLLSVTCSVPRQGILIAVAHSMQDSVTGLLGMAWQRHLMPADKQGCSSSAVAAGAAAVRAAAAKQVTHG